MPYTVDVTITNPDGQTATVSGAFSFVPAPTIAAVSPTSGPSLGGTTVTINGTNIQTGAKVFFGDLEAKVASIAPDGTSISVIAPPFAA